MEMEIFNKIENIMSQLPMSISDLKADYKYIMPYIQHIPEEVENSQREFLKICCNVLKIDTKHSWEWNKVNRQGVIGRIISDSNNEILNKYWNRFMCIDNNYREWCQPHYAFNYTDYKIENCTCINNEYPELMKHFRDKKIDIICTV